MNKRDGGWRNETGGMKARGMETGRELWFLMDKTIFLSSRKYELALLTKNRVRALLKIGPYRPPEIWRLQKKAVPLHPSFRDTTHTGFSEWQELINHH